MIYVIEDFNGFLCVTHTSDSFTEPTRVTIGWLSKVPSNEFPHVIGKSVNDGYRGSAEEGQLWGVDFGGYYTKTLRTEYLSQVIRKVPIKPPRKRRNRGPWRWDCGRWI